MVTATEARTIETASVTVTRSMVCYSQTLFWPCYYADQPDRPFGLYRRWFDVQVWADASGQLYAAPEGLSVEEPWRVALRRCFRCHADYVTTTARRVWHCRTCERRQKAASQRLRRERTRTRPTNCVQCGAPLTAKRSTRRYCTVRCRVAASRRARAGNEA